MREKFKTSVKKTHYHCNNANGIGFTLSFKKRNNADVLVQTKKKSLPLFLFRKGEASNLLMNNAR